MVFALSKILWVFASPSGLLILLLLAGLVLSASPRPCRARAGKRMSWLVAFCLLAIAFFPVGSWALLPLENRMPYTPHDQVDGIVVIGGDENPAITEHRNVPTALDSMRRFMTFMDLAKHYPNARLVYSGGEPFEHTGMQGAEVASAVLADLGVPDGGLIVEDKSRNTYENAVYSANIVAPTPDQKWLLVTSAWHMPRAIGCFRKAGWNIDPAPTGYFTDGEFHLFNMPSFTDQMHQLTLAVHEYVGLLSYRLMGRIDSLWPK